MVKQIAALEISNRYYKLVVGYTLDNKVDILYKVKKPLSVPFKDGDIFDIGSLSADLAKIKNIEKSTKNVKMSIGVNEVVLILPPYGLQVFQSVKSTNTVSQVSKIDRIDINNALSLIKKEKLPSVNDDLIDIIPNTFIIDGDKTFLTPPLNEISTTITIDANVYTLPKKMVSDIYKACENSQIKVKRSVVAPIGVSYLLTGSCPIVMRENSHKHAKAMAMFGAKQAFGIQHQTKVPVYYGDIFQCIDAAIRGQWERGKRNG